MSEQTNPYELMVTDICDRVFKKLETTVPNEERIGALVQEIVKNKTTTTIIIEDRRKTPVEIKPLDEPAHKALPRVIGILNAGCSPCLVGATGSGKTLGGFQYARLMGIPSYLVGCKQLTRMLSPHELVGYMTADGHYVKGTWTNAILGYNYVPKDGQLHPDPDSVVDADALVVLDEMDNSNENVIMYSKALPTGYIEMPYGRQRINRKLKVMATMNTWGQGATREYVGRCAQDAALLNEFCFVEWNYDIEFEWALLQAEFNMFDKQTEYKLEDMRRLLDIFIMMRKKADEQKVRCIISTRNIIQVARLLLTNQKWAINTALKMSIYKGMKDEDIKRVQCPELWTHKFKQQVVLQKPKTLGDLMIEESSVPEVETKVEEDFSNVECPIPERK